jgi:hypothetical protein
VIGSIQSLLEAARAAIAKVGGTDAVKAASTRIIGRPRNAQQPQSRDLPAATRSKIALHPVPPVQPPFKRDERP